MIALSGREKMANAARPIRRLPLALEDIHEKWTVMREKGEAVGTCLLHSCYLVLDYFFGEPWLHDHVLFRCRHSGYLTMRPQMVDDQMGVDKAHTLRVLELTEALFNLQGTPGLEECLGRMFSGQIEPTVAELNFGMFLRRLGADFRYVPATGVKGQDFDVEVFYADGRTVCCDIKCKIEGTDYSAPSLLRSLQKARKQLPSAKPCIVFVKVPQSWVDERTGQLGIEQPVADLLEEFFKSAGRVVSVAFYTKLLFDFDRGTHIHHVVYERENQRSRFADGRSWRLFDKPAPDGGWVDFTALMDGAHW